MNNNNLNFFSKQLPDYNFGKNFILHMKILRNSMEILLDIGMSIGPVIGYVHQYYIINKSKSVGSFSIDICGILLFANILRLNFYVFQKYALPLFFQSIIMIIAQICLVQICTKHKRNKNQIDQASTQSSFQHQNPEKMQNFWRWNLFSTYLLFIVFFTFVTFSVTITFNQLDVAIYGVMIGLVALLSQSILILPQILKNCKDQSTKGLSYLLVALNLSGDIFKLIYFIIKAQAFQFILCGVIQVCLDSFVIIQIFWYREPQLNEQNQRKAIQPEYNAGDQLKPQTQKDFDQIQMENIPQTQHQVKQTYQIQPKNQFQFRNQQIPSIQLQKIKLMQHEKLTNKNYSQQKCQLVGQNKDQKQKLPESDRNSFLETNPSDILQIKKVQSHQNNPSSSQTQFFKATFSHPIKSLQNIEVQC